MQRIVIAGCGGAGKSTLARQLGAVLGLKVVHLDALYWKAGWVATPKQEWQSIVRSVIAKDAWIIDGNFGSTRTLRFEAADTIIFLDFPRALCLARVMWRLWCYHGRSRPDMSAGCVESFDWEFLKWIWDFPKWSRPQLRREIAAYKQTRQVIVLRRPRHVTRFLKQLSRGT